MPHSLSKHRRSLLPVFLTYLLDNFGLGVIYPILTPLFLNPNHVLFPESTTFLKRTVLLGLLIGAFPLAQFFGAPLIGQFSDRFGRRKAFYVTILGISFGYTLTALSILENILPMLFISRFITGLCAGNQTLCLAAIADLSPDQQSRAKNFGLIGSIGGLSFILAIFFGGILSDRQVSSHFNPSLPFWITAALSYANFFLMILLFKETHPRRAAVNLNPVKNFENISLALRQPYLRMLYLINFFFMLTWVTTMQFFPTILIKRFSISFHNITFILMAVGLTWSLSNLSINRYLAKRIYPAKTLLVSLLILSLCAFLMGAPLQLPLFLCFFFPSVICASLCWTNGLATISIKASSELQGSILGINQSMNSIAAMTGPAIGGILVAFGDHTIFLFAGVSSLTAFALLYKNKIFLP